MLIPATHSVLVKPVALDDKSYKANNIFRRQRPSNTQLTRRRRVTIGLSGLAGEYSFLPATRWLHNLEHGGIALLYHPCAPQTLIDDLRRVCPQSPPDGSGPFRWIMTPYDNLPSAIALVAWEWVYESNCMRPDEMYDFVRARYRQAPEDIVSSGAFSEGYIGR